MDLLFGQSDEMSENQPTLGLDDGAGLRVVKARFVSQRKFDWELFAGYDPFRPTSSQQATEERLCQQASTTLML